MLMPLISYVVVVCGLNEIRVGCAVGLIVFLGGCSVNALADKEGASRLWLDEQMVPARYGVPCFDKHRSKKDKVSQLLSQFKAEQLTHVELAKKIVVLCPAQPELVVWLTEQAERSL